MVSLQELWISLKETIQNLGTISIISILVIIIILIILIVIEKNLKGMILIRRNRNNFYLEAINKLDQKNPSKTLKKIDNLTIEFFKECFKVKNSKGYSELNDIFLKGGNKEIAEFCNTMNDVLYSGKKITSDTNNKLISKLVNIIKNNPISEKQRIIKKPKKSFFDKIKFWKNSENIEVSGVNKKNLNSK